MWGIKIFNALFLLLQAACTFYDVRIRAVPRWLLLLAGAMAALSRIAGIGGGTWELRVGRPAWDWLFADQ